MSTSSFKNARFVITAMSSEQYPILKNRHGENMPEIAVVGRSNVGKSSLLNHLFQSPGLVKTSSKPGKTQAINFFTVSEQIAFVDLPGYGYAEVPLSVRKKWKPMIENYLLHRQSLKLILFLFDIRRIPNEEDKQLLEWFSMQQKSVILVLTKVDKVNQAEKHANTKAILNAFNAVNLHHILYSVTKNVGRMQLMKMAKEALEEKDDENGGD